MKTPECVVFDLGKVLVDFDYGDAARQIGSRCDGRECNIRALIDQSPLLIRFETGHITAKEFYSEVSKAAGFLGSEEEFGPLFGDIFRPIPEMVAFNEALRAHGLPTYIFSNTNSLAAETIRRKLPFFSNFTKYIYSYEHGSMKPHARIYEVVEEWSGKKRDAILYIDDRLENIEAGITRGWQTIHHVSSEVTLKRASQLGLPVK